MNVYVVNLGRKYLYLQWVDPDSGRRITRSSRCTTRRDAERRASILENQLSSSGKADGSLLWPTFVDVYESRHLMGLAVASGCKALGVLESYGRLMGPKTVGDVRTSKLTDYAARLRKAGRSEATIASHLGALKAALRWAKSQDLIPTVPQVPAVARSLSGRRAKGRALTDAEFVAMLRATRGVVGKPAARSWRHLLRGLWLSGLRLQEALALSWEPDAGLWIDTSGAFPTLRIMAESEKGFRDRVLPLTPDFARFILRERDRTGAVFAPIGERGEPIASHYHASRVISAIGKAAGIIVDRRKGKHASAHDLRRSFGSRWARRVLPQVLRELMRHESLETTMQFYVDLRGEQTAADLWREFGDAPTQLSAQQ